MRRMPRRLQRSVGIVPLVPFAQMDKAVILARIDELLALPPTSQAEQMATASYLLQGTITLLALTHGPKSPQLLAFEAQMAAAQSKERHWTYRAFELRS